MKGTLTTIHPDGTVTKRSYVGREAPLEDLNKAVEGYLELVPYFNRYDGQRCVALCNEEGKIKGFPVNALMTGLWWAQLPQQQWRMTKDYLVGSIAILQGDQEFMDNI